MPKPCWKEKVRAKVSSNDTTQKIQAVSGKFKQIFQSFLSLKGKDNLLVKYAMHNISSQLFVNKYQLYLPNKEELSNEIESLISREDSSNE